MIQWQFTICWLAAARKDSDRAEVHQFLVAITNETRDRNALALCLSRSLARSLARCDPDVKVIAQPFLRTFGSVQSDA